MIRLLSLLVLLALAGCGGAPAPIQGCVAAASQAPVCEFQRPEDMELLPDGRTLLISQMGAMDGTEAGALALYDTVSGTIGRLPLTPTVAAESWGSADCREPPGPALSPHGIDLLRRADSALQLFVVNHGGRESVELYELRDEAGGWSLSWRGCVTAPERIAINDVAALPDASFVISHMFPRDAPVLGGLNLYVLWGALGFDTGYALRCDARGCEKLPGTDAPFPNGVQVDAAGSTLYLNAYLAGEVRKISLSDGALLGTAAVRAPDNSQWTDTGQLLIASHTASKRAIQSCFAIREGACAAAYAIVELDPRNMRTRTVLAHEGPPMGAATVAQVVGDMMYLGSFSGDRIVAVPRPSR